MKVIKRIRDIHLENKSRYDRLCSDVCDLLKPKSEERGWFFTYRVKELPSFALKLETGRVADPSAPDDFFACTIVVQTLERVDDAEALVLEHFDFRERKPKKGNETLKAPFDFRFDDLRLYVSRRSHVSGRDEDLVGLVFEVQIKTVLQYAWSIATHDLIYKTDTVSWPKERIAFQVKAMLEHAEIAIAEAERLAISPSVAMNDPRTSCILKVISQIEQFWPKDALPEDLKRLAENILGVLQAGDVKDDQLLSFLEAEKRRIGLLPRDMSPYAFSVQALAQSTVIDFKSLFNRSRVRTRLLVHDNMDIPPWMKEGHERIIRIVC